MTLIKYDQAQQVFDLQCDMIRHLLEGIKTIKPNLSSTDQSTVELLLADTAYDFVELGKLAGNMERFEVKINA